MSTVAAEFHYEYEAEIEALLRRRMSLWAGTWLIVCIIRLFFATPVWGVIAPSLVAFVVALGWIRSRKGGLGQDEILRLAFWMLVAVSVIEVFLGQAGPVERSGRAGTGTIALVAGMHLLASFFLPWTPWQALQPAIPMVLTWIGGEAILDPAGFTSRFAGRVVIGIAAMIPGIVVCAIRQTRFGRSFSRRMLRRHHDVYAQELFDARKIHEALFPQAKLDGPIRFTWRDLPRAGIGGDCLHAAFDQSGSLNMVLLNVAGDGIAAALTVNRLHGELERLFAERPELAPNEAIGLLDHYAKLTLAPLGIFAAAMCLRIGRDGRVEWCGAGHAPVYIRGAMSGRTPRKLESSTWLLGASATADETRFTSETKMSGDEVLIAMTGGAFEQYTAEGKRLGVAGVEAIVGGAAPADPLAWPTRVLETLGEARGAGVSATEDVLVAAVIVVGDGAGGVVSGGE